MTQQEVTVMKYDLLHDLATVAREASACAPIPGGGAQPKTPRPAASLRTWLHADSIATPGRW